MKNSKIIVASIFLTTPTFAASLAVKKVVVGTNHSCALLENGYVKCWGKNDSGQLGTGDNFFYGRHQESMGANLPQVNLGTNVKAQDICAGANHNCAVLSDGGVKCWGKNESGELGRNVDNAGISPLSMGDYLQPINLGESVKMVSIACGNRFTCATTDSGRAKCWGNNEYGQLGIGSTIAKIGRDQSKMGNALPYVDLGSGVKIQSLKLGSGHACAMSTEGRVKCWGANGSGQLGYEDMNIRGTDASQMGDKLPFVNLGTTVMAKNISIGNWHTCAAISSGSIKCWGTNNSGNLGNGNLENYGDRSDTMGDALPTVLLGTLRPTAVYGNAEHTCALSNSGRLKCWGPNNFGQLGIGDNEARGADQSRMNDQLPDANIGLPIRMMSEGSGYHSCALLVNGTVKCWGKNFYGQLGYNDDDARGTSINDLGDFLPFVSLQ